MKTLLIARHGNTFNRDELPRRVGKHTDIPLVDSGQEQAQRLGQYLLSEDLIPDVIYCSQLQRTRQTAQFIMTIIGQAIPIYADEIFDEIDYGVDENKTEADVIARIGEDAIQRWNEKNIVPPGWQVDSQQICQQWQQFANGLLADNNISNALVVTSNGIAKFAPCLLATDYPFDQHHPRKIATGALCRFDYEPDNWHVKQWNYRPG